MSVAKKCAIAVVYLCLSMSVSAYEDHCSLYLAESVEDVTGRATMGVYTGVDLQEGDQVGELDMAIPLTDVAIHNALYEEALNMDLDEEDRFWWLLSNLAWDPMDVGGETEGAHVQSASPGLGSMVRGAGADDYNVGVSSPAHFDSAGLHRDHDPSAGAISYYHGIPTVATADIKAGQELYHHFGHHYHITLEENQKAALLAKANQAATSTERAKSGLKETNNDLLAFYAKYQSLESRHGHIMSDDFRSKLLDMLKDNSGALRETLQETLPDSWDEVNETLANAVENTKYHSLDFLREHGLCLDNLVPEQSNTEGAGRGAFAKRTLEEGSLIAPAPLLHLAHKSVLDMYFPHYDPERGMLISGDVSGQQLLLNYCFGHAESTKLLCPLGVGTAYINHSPTPNAAIRWTSGAHQGHHPNAATPSSSDLYSFEPNSYHREDWLQKSVEELDEETDIGLMMEYYALRDIAPGEEVTIDYGEEWEVAWNEHVESWVPPKSRKLLNNKEMGEYLEEDFEDDSEELYASAVVWNDRLKNFEIRTEDEQEEYPYPLNIETSCYYYYEDDGKEWHDEEGIYDRFFQDDDEESGYGEDGELKETWVKEHYPLSFANEFSLHLFRRPCRVLEKAEIEMENDENGEVATYVQYTVEIMNLPHMKPELLIPDDMRLIVENMPRDDIVFTDTPYSTDLHLPKTFRHEMMFPDDIFPEAWRNLLAEDEEQKTATDVPTTYESA
jgi:hypothetical protein